MVKLNKIYTRTGDDGTTGLVTGDRVPKADPRVGAIGCVDELNAVIGTAMAALDGETALMATLTTIQNDLFDLGADLATPGDLDGALRVTGAQVAWLETQIDRVNDDLPPLTSFVLPSGTPAAAALHHARAVARRAERDVWLMNDADPDRTASRAVTGYLNRLSDFLFVAARQAARAGGEEILWQPGGDRQR